jgi:hypothetical protein
MLYIPLAYFKMNINLLSDGFVCWALYLCMYMGIVSAPCQQNNKITVMQLAELQADSY